MNEQVKELITALGAMAEMLGLFRRKLHKNGFTAEESLKMSQALMIELMIPKHKEENENG